jgi:transposase
MPSPYSYDLRIRAIELIESGKTIVEVSKLLDISRDALHRWKKQKVETGDIKFKTGYQKGYGNKITNLEKFKEFIDNHGDKTLAQMVELWPEPISYKTISKHLKMLGITRKKRLMDIKKETKLQEKNLRKS